jgi:hypothetical protein
MSERTRPPNRRRCELIDFESMGLRFTAGVGRYPDGQISELFLDNHKAGSSISVLVRDLAILFSLAVQHGADAHRQCRSGVGAAGRDSRFAAAMTDERPKFTLVLPMPAHVLDLFVEFRNLRNGLPIPAGFGLLDGRCRP